MKLYEIETGFPVPGDPCWDRTLSILEKGNSFCVALEENLFELYDAAKALGLGITHRMGRNYIRVWRVN